jgi:Nitrile hydratase beta subunit
VLDFHKIINTEDKRGGVEAVAAEILAKLTYYERWIVAFSDILFRKGISLPPSSRKKWMKPRRGGS